MSRAHHSASGEPSQRMLRVGELIRHAMSDLLSRGEINDPVLETHVVTIPGVRMSPDLKLATIFVMPLGGQDAETTLRLIGDVPELTVGAPTFPNFLDALSIGTGRRILTVLGQCEAQIGRAHV